MVLCRELIIHILLPKLYARKMVVEAEGGARGVGLGLGVEWRGSFWRTVIVCDPLHFMETSSAERALML